MVRVVALVTTQPSALALWGRAMMAAMMLARRLELVVVAAARQQ